MAHFSAVCWKPEYWKSGGWITFQTVDRNATQLTI